MPSTSNPIIRSLFLIALLVLAPSYPAPAATHTWTGAAGGYWSAAGSWSGGAPVAGEASPVILVFPAAGSKFTTNDVANLTLDQIQVSGDNYWIAATGSGTNVALRTAGIISSTFFISGANSILTNFTFNIVTNVLSFASISVSTGDAATFRSRFTGDGGLVKHAAGTAKLQGGAPNTYLGDTTINGGILQLSHTSNAIPGDLIIGNPSLISTGTVELLVAQQIANTANVTVWQNGILDCNVHSETMTTLTISNVVQSSGPNLTVLTQLVSRGQSTFSGILQLAGASRTLHVADGQLDVTGFIENNSGSAGFSKTGPGTLRLAQTNGFNGQVFIHDGKIIAAHNGALGSSATTFVNDGASLEVASGIAIDEDLVLYGPGFGSQGALILRTNATCSDLVSLITTPTVINVPDSNSVGTLSWIVLGGGGIKKIGNGTLRLGGNFDNAFSGESTVVSGKLELAKPAGVTAVAGNLHIGQDNFGVEKSVSVRLVNPDQISDTAEVFVDVDGLLDLNGKAEAIGSLVLRRGNVDSGLGTLTLKGNVLMKSPQNVSIGGYGSTIKGNLALGGATRFFNCEGDSAFLSVIGSISDGGAPAGITFIGATSVSMLSLFNGSSTYTGPTVIQDGILWLQDGATPGSAAGGTTILGTGRLLLDNTSVGNESLTMNTTSNFWFSHEGNIRFFDTNSWAGPVNLETDTAIFTEFSNYRLTFSGPISGPGALRKNQTGTVVFAGPNDNLFAGPLTVDGGVLELNKSSGAVAIPGALIIGNNTDPANSAVVRLKAANQIHNSAPITVEPSGRLDIDNFNETIGPLTMDGGNVFGLFGILTLTSDVLCRGTNLISLISSFVSLGANTRNFQCLSDATLYCNSSIADGGGNAGVTKTGPGTLAFAGPNTYGGDTTVADGNLSLSFAGRPGNTTGGTIVHSNATLTLDDTEVLNEALTLHGNSNESYSQLVAAGGAGVVNLWGGPVTLINEAGIGCFPQTSLKLGGTVSGDGLRFKGSGVFYLTGNGDNTHTGTTRVVQGNLILQKTNGVAIPGALEILNGTSHTGLQRANQIGDLASVTVNFAAELDLNGFAETIGSLAGSSTSFLNDVTNTFTVGGNNQSTIFSGQINGGGGSAITNLVKKGSGTLTLANHHTISGRTLVTGGELKVAGSLSNSPVTLYSGARLSGNGTLASLTSNGGIIAPSGITPGSRYGRITTIGSINLGSASQFQVDVGGTNVGTNLDQLEMLSGVLTLPGCALVVTQNFAGAISNEYPILNVVTGGASMGTFTGYNEGANVISSSGQTLRINYFAGSGNNDIVLTQLSASAGAASFTGIVKLPGGIQLDGLGTANAQYLLQANTNLATLNWIDLGEVNANGAGALQYLDTTSTNYPMRFYRFKSP